MALVDTHAHLGQTEFANDLTGVLERAQAAGVESIIAIGVTALSSEKVVELAGHHANIYAAVGTQPNHTGEAVAGDWERVVSLIERPRVVALGETGLDRYWDRAPFDVQRDYFDRHIRLSQDAKLPFVVHMRECEADILEMLREARRRGPIAGVMHSFTGTAETASECLSLGLYISFAGMVTYKNAEALREVAKLVPDNRILVETDSPYLSPVPLRGKRNEPAHVAHTAALLAETRGQSVEDFCHQTTVNARALFRLR